MGHTHEDIDQLFSKIGDEIRRTGCESIPGTHTHTHTHRECCTHHELSVLYICIIYIISYMHNSPKKCPILFILDLLQLIHRSSTPNPMSYLLSCVWDFKCWLEPVLGAVGGHSKYLVFRFTRGSTNRAEMHYKRYSAMPWEPAGVGIHLLSVILLNLLLFILLSNILYMCTGLPKCK